MGNRDADEFLDGAKEGGFEAGVAKIEGIIEVGVGEDESVAVARGGFYSLASVSFGDFTEGGFGNRRAARVRKTEDFRDFVETFADGVVVGGADDFEMVVGGHADDLGVAAGNHKR